MSETHWALIETIYAALVNYEPLQSQVHGIYDYVPQSAELPYICLGRTQERPWLTKTFDGSEHVITLDLWTRDLGRKQIAAMMKAVREALANIAMSDLFNCVLFQFEFSEILRDLDDGVMHGVMRYRATIQNLET